jgi:hypothetical protein
MMTELRLSRLPDRNPVKITINLPPDLHQELNDYGDLYSARYQQEEPLTELIPAMLRGFLESDRAFVRARASKSKKQ